MTNYRERYEAEMRKQRTWYQRRQDYFKRLMEIEGVQVGQLLTPCLRVAYWLIFPIERFRQRRRYRICYYSPERREYIPLLHKDPLRDVDHIAVYTDHRMMCLVRIPDNVPFDVFKSMHPLLQKNLRALTPEEKQSLQYS